MPLSRREESQVKVSAVAKRVLPKRGALIALAALACTLTVSSAASAAPKIPPAQSGSRVIGAKPIHLTQPGDPGLGHLTPTSDAARRGMFGPQVAWPIVAIHAALARSGHVISYGTPLGNGTTQGGVLFDSWDPAAGVGAKAHVQSDSMGYDSFCNSLVELADGDLLMVGGNSTMSTMTYDPASGEVMMGRDLNHQRWYATTLRLTSGKILVLGGTDYYNRHTVQGLPPKTTTGTTPEIGDGVHAWRSLPGAAVAAAFGATGSHWFYPRAFNGPHGQVVGISNNQLWTLNPAGKGQVRLMGKLPYKPAASGSQVMYQPGKVLVASGGTGGPESSGVASASAVTVDFNAAKPKVKRTQNVLYPGNWLNLTVLPTGEVLANGGTTVGTLPESRQLTAEIWNPTTSKWRTAATAQRTRTYHSTSLLLPSGAVFTGGSGAAPHTAGGTAPMENNLNAELYYPASLFEKSASGAVRWAPRPLITSISGSATYAGKVRLGIKSASKIRKVSLISVPSVTHSQNTDQRRVPLTFTQRGAAVAVTLPSSVNTLPPGDWELTVVNAKGAPSPAQIITLRKGAPGLITPAS